MGFWGLITNIAVLPLDIALDVTCITPTVRVVNDSDKESPFGTIDRLEAIVKNLEDIGE